MAKMHAGAIKHLNQRARELRNNSTHAEEILWGYFYCHSLKLAIEVDGNIHDGEDVKRNDQQRQALLEKDKLIVIRFSNDELEQNPEQVLKRIEEFIFKTKR